MLIYNRCYILVVVGLMITLIVTTLSLLGQESTKINTLVLCDEASEELSRIQQKYINLIAYKWLKVVSLEYSFDFSDSMNLMQEAISSLLASDYIVKIEAAYTKDISDQVLFGNVCPFFNNPATCVTYRNDLFNFGFSMLLPFSIKEELETANVSTNYMYYTGSLCDKTWLLFDGVIPMTNTISVQSLSEMEGQLAGGFVTSTI